MARCGAGVALVAGWATLGGCVHVADQQSARLLDPGTYEVTPAFSSTTVSFGGESERLADQYGIRLGYGAGDGVELRAMYERIEEARGDAGLNVLGFGGKFALAEEAVALFVPVGFMFGEEVTEPGDTWTLAPTLLATWRAMPGFELTPSVKAIYPFTVENSEILIAFHLGAGLSNDLDRWAIRPEIGMTKNPGEEGTMWGWTIGFSYRP